MKIYLLFCVEIEKKMIDPVFHFFQFKTSCQRYHDNAPVQNAILGHHN